MDYIRLTAIAVEQKIGTFFLTKMQPEDIAFISRTDLSRYENYETGIQRNISKQRQNEIKNYLLDDPEATFPNSIIISISNDFNNPDLPNYVITDNGDTVTIEILRRENVASVLDGQHRMSGLSDGLKSKFEMPVSIFINPPLSTQAKIFAKVNGTQVRVSNDLVYDLFGITKGRSTARTAYSLVKRLNEDDDSVWKNGIKTLTDRTGYIAQGAFAKYIDKELFSEGKILRGLYEKERDNDILFILKNYFKAVSVEFNDVWNLDDKSIILQKTTGFVGLMKYFSDLLLQARESELELSEEYFSESLAGSFVVMGDLTNDNYPAGAKGQMKFYKCLKLKQNEKGL
jgi:DGQHR domain-containing protein